MESLVVPGRLVDFLQLVTACHVAPIIQQVDKLESMFNQITSQITVATVIDNNQKFAYKTARQNMVSKLIIVE
jgi:hypothetical protein